MDLLYSCASRIRALACSRVSAEWTSAASYISADPICSSWYPSTRTPCASSARRLPLPTDSKPPSGPKLDASLRGPLEGLNLDEEALAPLELARHHRGAQAHDHLVLGLVVVLFVVGAGDLGAAAAAVDAGLG